LKICLILLLSSSLAATPCFAQEGKFVQLKETEPIPFDGWCFDNEATGQIFGVLKHSKKLCELKTEEALAKQKAKYNLDIGNLKLRIGSLEDEKNSILKIKNEEIESLEIAALKRPNEYNHWWATGGFLVGTLTTIAVLFLVRGESF